MSLAKRTLRRILTSKQFSLHSEDSRDLAELFSSAFTAFAVDPACLSLNGSFKVVGDIHGNIQDLVRIFSKIGYPPEVKYLFLGDLVDRGENSVEVMALICCLKLLYPCSLYVLRGNHEFEEMSHQYGFEDECFCRFDKDVFLHASQIFSQLSIVAIINGSAFCSHGGISNSIHSREDIQSLQKYFGNGDIPTVISDILWSDPSAKSSGFEPSVRGCGWQFGQTAASSFMKECGFDLMVRSHEMCENGFQYPFGDTVKCLTVFSSTNYCGMGNKATIISLNEKNQVEFTYFDAIDGDEQKKIRARIPQWLIVCDDEETKMKRPVFLSKKEKMVSAFIENRPDVFATILA